MLSLLSLAAKELAKQIGSAAVKQGSNKIWILLAGDAEGAKFDEVNRRLDQVLNELNKVRTSISEVKTQIDDFHADVKMDDVDRYANQIESLYDQYMAALDSLKNATKAEMAGDSAAALARKRAIQRLTELGIRVANEIYSSVKQINSLLAETGDRSLFALVHKNNFSRDFLSYFIVMKSLFVRYYVVQSKAIFIMSLVAEDPSVYFTDGGKLVRSVEEMLDKQERFLLTLIPHSVVQLVSAIAASPDSTPIRLRSAIAGRGLHIGHMSREIQITNILEEWRLEPLQPLNAHHKEGFYFRVRNIRDDKLLILSGSQYRAQGDIRVPGTPLSRAAWKIRCCAEGRFWLEFLSNYSGGTFNGFRLATWNCGSNKDSLIGYQEQYDDSDKYQQFYIEPFAVAYQGLDRLIHWERLNPGYFIESNSCGYRFYYRENGNFEVVGVPEGEVVWSANVECSAPGWLTMQNEGNLVAYSAKGERYWASHPDSPEPWNAQYNILRLHDDGALSIGTPGQRSVWRSQAASYQERPSYIVGLEVIAADYPEVEPPKFYTKIPYDLNAGAKGDFIYLCYREWAWEPDSLAQAVTAIKIIYNDEPTPPGFVKIHRDLNQGAGGDFVYLCYKMEDYDQKTAINKIIIIGGDKADLSPPSGYVKVSGDLNKGAGGQYINVCICSGGS